MNKNLTNTTGIRIILKQFTYQYHNIDLSVTFLMLQTTRHLDIHITSYGQNRWIVQNNILAVMCRPMTCTGRLMTYRDRYITSTIRLMTYICRHITSTSQLIYFIFKACNVLLDVLTACVVLWSLQVSTWPS